MDHKQWLEYEEKCIQERPPACVTACPVHVDVRSFTAQMKAGNFHQALNIFRRNVPFPGIIGRICDHPCESACKRGEVGDPVSIAALEKACVQMGAAKPAKVAVAPNKGKQVAVVGGGLSGLSAAFSLAGKGYGVVLFEAKDRLGGSLWDMPEETLPRSVLVEEVNVLRAMGVEVRLETVVGQNMSPEDLVREFDAVYVGVGLANTRAEHPVFGLEVNGAGHPVIDPVTFATSRKGVFAGGRLRTGRSDSPIASLSDGRRAAVSIDRFLQNVSLTAVRENEGPYTSALFTSTQGIAPLPAVVPQSGRQGYSREEAMEEASRCMDCQCLECVKNCEFLAHYQAYPKKYARQINQNLRIVMGIHGANTLINSCSLCGLCKEVCPTDFDVSELIREARTEMVKNGKMPPSAHDFPLQEMEFNNSDEAAFVRNQPRFESSQYVFFPGCQFSASYPDGVERVYSYLTQRMSGGVGLMMRCCGAPADWAGRTDLFQSGLQEIRAQWHDMGRPRFVMACSTCYQTFKNHLPEIDLVSLWQLYDELGLPQVEGVQRPRVVSVHDSCTTRYESPIHDSVRSILAKLGVEIEELEHSRERTECCGYGGLQMYANPTVADASIQRRIAEGSADYVAYCSMCRDNFAAKGKKTHHILDLIYGPGSAAAEPDQRGPGIAQKRRNKVSLKSKILTEVWGEKVTMEDSPHKSIQLIIPQEVSHSLEERLISEEDIQKVIEYAQRTGNKVLNRANGHTLACLTPTRVTYWVEYAQQRDGYFIYNAYSHRMVVEGNS